MTKGLPVDHRTALATFRTLAHRTGTTAGRAALTTARRVSTGLARRRAARDSTPSVDPPTVVPARRPAADDPAPVPTRGRSAASPVDVARAVARNAAGLTRSNPGPLRRRPLRRSAPGDKLPARTGQGIVGV